MARRLMLVDDHPVVRQGLTAFLEAQRDLRVVAEAGTIADARRLLAGEQVDLVLLDLLLPDGNGLTLLPDALSVAPPPRVAILTSLLEEHSLREAMRLGASGYLLKHAGTASLLDGVRAVLRGELALDGEALRLLARPAEADPLHTLTPREREVLALLAQGLSNRAIGERLDIAEKTVKTHLGHVFDKLDVSDRVQAALLAKQHGL